MLKWDDYKGDSLPKSKKKGKIISDIGMDYSVINDTEYVLYSVYPEKKPWVPVVEINAVFDPSKSYCPERGKTDADLMHEQIHFDIAEIYVRLFRKEIKEKAFDYAEDVYKKTPKLYRFYKKEMQKYQTLYDKETECGKNLTKQSEWNIKIENELKALNEYAKPKTHAFILFGTGVYYK